MSRHVVACWAVLIVALSRGSARADLINGSFESPANPPEAGNYLDLTSAPAGAYGFCGWTIESGSVDIVDGRAPLFGIDWSAAAAIDGDQILDLNGFVNGVISQVFATVPTQAYTLSFYIANNPLPGQAESGIVTISDVATQAVLLTLPLDHTNSTLTAPNWEHVTQNFSATGTLSRIRFTSTTPNGGASDGVILDAVSIVGVSAASIRGDMNGDAHVTVSDVSDFIAALLGQPLSTCGIDHADVNQDGLDDGKDVQPFTALILAQP